MKVYNVHERYTTPTIDDLIHTLNGATVFSKLDLRSGYHQLTLAPESTVTYLGLWRYCILNFGTNSASEIFQKQINEQVRDIPGVLNISDDVVKPRLIMISSFPKVCKSKSDV